MGIDAKSGQLIECVNPEHWKLGSIHYVQPDCVGKSAKTEPIAVDIGCFMDFVITPEQKVKVVSVISYLFTADSDESWQASEALLKR